MPQLGPSDQMRSRRGCACFDGIAGDHARAPPRVELGSGSCLPGSDPTSQRAAAPGDLAERLETPAADPYHRGVRQPWISIALLPFEAGWREHAVPDLLAHWVVEHLDMIEHVPSGLLADFVRFAPDALVLELGEEALGDGVILIVAAMAHRVLKIMSVYEGSSVHAG